MTILGKDILPHHGPYIDFATLEEPPADAYDIPRSAIVKGLFFELSDSLLGCYCDITRSYAPFDLHDTTLLSRPHDIHELAAKLLMWEFQIARAPDFHFNHLLSSNNLEDLALSREQLKADLLETLHFVVGHLHRAAASNKCVVVDGY